MIGFGLPSGAAAQAALAFPGRRAGTTIEVMRIPGATGRIRADGVVAAPAQALRAAFTQVGRLLLAADELRGRIRAEHPDGRPPPPREPWTPPPAAAAEVTGLSALPVPNYDELSLPSLRARLRTLSADQLRVLARYERAHSGRADIVGMFERRLAKLAASDSAARQDGAQDQAR
ncbi:MAG TPA: hypothetical protein VIZ00_14285 [Streptosporangiaceae bacterium]